MLLRIENLGTARFLNFSFNILGPQVTGTPEKETTDNGLALQYQLSNTKFKFSVFKAEAFPHGYK